jgi:AraC-like DNA-binding protein
MIITIGIILTLFLSLILLSKKNKSLSDKILLAWLISIAIMLLLYKLQTEELRDNYAFLLGWGFPFPLLQWPFLYLYVLSLTSKKPLKINHLLHFIPFLLSILLFSNYLASPDQIKLDIYNRQGEGYETEMNINLIAIILSAMAYTFLSIRELRSYHQNIKNEFSYTERITLNWLVYLTVAMSFILFLVLVYPIDNFIYSAVTGLVFYIGYFGINQLGIFTEKQNSQHSSHTKEFFNLDFQLKRQSSIPEDTVIKSINNHQIEISDKVKYEKTKISNSEMSSIHLRLKSIMNEEKLFKNPELTLAEVALKISIQPNILSQVINTLEGKNFYDFINGQRIEEFQRIALSPSRSKYSLLSLAFESGFNSKTSFNRNFKKVTNLSPSEFLKQKDIQLLDL